jgi:hypothetical protein
MARTTGVLLMFGSFRLRGLLPFAALTLAVVLGGCVAYPAYPGYGYYGGGYSGGSYYGGPYYGGGAVVAYGGGWGWRGRDGWRDRDWYR